MSIEPSVVGIGECSCGDPECRRASSSRDRGSFSFELIALAGLGLLFFSLLSFRVVQPQQLASLWFMPFLGVAAATIAMATPAGGGVVFFPTMVLLGVPPFQAVAFSVGAQAVGMGIFGTFNWIKRDRSAILSPVVFATVPIAAAATLLALFVFPVAEARPLQLTFSLFGIGLAAYIFIGLRAGLDRGTRRFRFSPFMVGALAAVGLLGGLSVGYIGVGVDALLFLVLTSLFRIDTHEATVTGIIARSCLSTGGKVESASSSGVVIVLTQLASYPPCPDSRRAPAASPVRCGVNQRAAVIRRPVLADWPGSSCADEIPR